VSVRITSKGQVTIPVAIREKAGLLPNTEVEFVCNADGQVTIAPARKWSKRETPADLLVEQLREFGRRHPLKMTTEEIMALMRGED
jgi:AbrB family looped-hinge helix DNA binding protein